MVLESGDLPQPQLLRTATNSEDILLQSLRKQQTGRIVEERRLRKQNFGEDENFAVGRLQVFENFASSTVYWKG